MICYLGNNYINQSNHKLTDSLTVFIMPNFVNNKIQIGGPIHTIKQLWQDYNAKPTDDDSLLNAMIPMPESERENWYNWRLHNWGTKWDAIDAQLEFTDNGDGTAYIRGSFETAWSPPHDAYERYIVKTKMMPDIYIISFCHECDMGLVGYWIHSNHIHQTNVYEYDCYENENKLRDQVPYFLIDIFDLTSCLQKEEEEEE